jgi:glycopeptide antibiotics resistance protein
MHLQLLKPIIVVLAIVVPLWVVSRLLIRSRSAKSTPTLQSELAYILLVAYIAVIVALTILPISIAALQSPKERGVNLIPFVNTYKDYVDSLSSTDRAWKDYALENIIGNVLLFIPLGIILPAMFKRCRSFKMVILISFCSSSSIELIQLLLRLLAIHRTADVDDIILNSLGGAIGYFIFWLSNHLRQPRQSETL